MPGTQSISTSLSMVAAVGTKILSVVGHDGFAIGHHVVIDPGKINEEFNVIVGFSSLILKYPLLYDHAAGAVITVVPDRPERCGVHNLSDLQRGFYF